MAIKIGERLPEATLCRMGAEGPEQIELSSLTAGRKVALFGLPGAFTGTCSTAHVPSFMRNRDALAAKGIDEVICVSVNDPFVMGAWSDATGAGEAGLQMLGDADASFTKAIGLDFSAPPVGLINRSKRYALVAEDGVVSLINVEDNPGVCEMSAAETLLDQL